MTASSSPWPISLRKGVSASGSVFSTDFGDLGQCSWRCVLRLGGVHWRIGQLERSRRRRTFRRLIQQTRSLSFGGYFDIHLHSPDVPRAATTLALFMDRLRAEGSRKHVGRFRQLPQGSCESEELQDVRTSTQDQAVVDIRKAENGVVDQQRESRVEIGGPRATGKVIAMGPPACGIHPPVLVASR
jgi:hypothetical protein